MKKVFAMLSIVGFAFCMQACSDNDAEPSTTGKLIFEFDARVGTQNLQIGTGSYQNVLGQDFKVDLFRYYISNIKLQRIDGTFYEDPLSKDGSKGYYLIDDSNPASTLVTLENVPAGNYVGAEFTIGVDANRVSQGAQTGALDPANNHFWSWNSGYIFVRIEGTSSYSTETDNEYLYHVGGYKTDPAIPMLANNIKIKSIVFGGEEAVVSTSSQPEIHIVVDVQKFFAGETTFDFSENAQCHMPACAVGMANNYENTFVFDHLHQ